MVIETPLGQHCEGEWIKFVPTPVLHPSGRAAWSQYTFVLNEELVRLKGLAGPSQVVSEPKFKDGLLGK